MAPKLYFAMVAIYVPHYEMAYTYFMIFDSLGTISLRHLPRLPGRVSAWFSRNLWLFAIVFGLLCAFDVIAHVAFIYYLHFALRHLFFSIPILERIYVVTQFAVDLLLIAGASILSLQAIRPLRHTQRRGWARLYLAVLAVCVDTVLLPIVMYPVHLHEYHTSSLGILVYLVQILLSLMICLCALYVLCQVRDRFTARTH